MDSALLLNALYLVFLVSGLTFLFSFIGASFGGFFRIGTQIDDEVVSSFFKILAVVILFYVGGSYLGEKIESFSRLTWNSSSSYF